MSDLRLYPKLVQWSPEDEGWIATAPDLPGCSAFGETEQDALGEMEFAIEAWVEAAHLAGNPIPPPSTVQADEYSGKFVVRLPRSLHADLARSAKHEGVSLNQLVVTLLSAAHALKSVEAAARASADIVISTVSKVRATQITHWRRGTMGDSPIRAFGYLPANWSHLTSEQREAEFNLHPSAQIISKR